MSNQIKRDLEKRIDAFTGKSPKELSKREMYESVCYLLISKLKEKHIKPYKTKTTKTVYYFSMEFLPGTLLKSVAFNLGLVEELTSALKEFGFSYEEIIKIEPDIGLGNGGLGRLASCYLESLTTNDINAQGVSICYRYGLFKQVIRNNEQFEELDKWQDLEDCWLTSKVNEKETIIYSDYQVIALPRDIYIPGYHSNIVNTLRLWEAHPIDKTSTSKENAYSISKTLYPKDNHDEGKLLRIRQQYFFVSAQIKSLLRSHYSRYGTLNNLDKLMAFHINDTHPTLLIPELFRVMMDEYGYAWDKAEEIIRKCVFYTNHTILSVALEKWPIKLFSSILPRILEIILEIDRRCKIKVLNNKDCNSTRIIQGETIHMANICLHLSTHVNGVSELHTNILKSNTFSSFNKLYPDKIVNITNGISYRRWLCQANPNLSNFIEELIGPNFLKDAKYLEDLLKFQDDNQVLDTLFEIKNTNKKKFAYCLKELNSVKIDPNSLFDVQVKRLHEYKRQLLNVIHIMYLFEKLKENPDITMQPITFIFGAKAYPSYSIAKSIISLILNLAEMIERYPSVRNKIKIVFIENYDVSAAEITMPAAEVSKQISLAGKEASGTGNMKLMINGALTLGTLDGANIEIMESVGTENIYIFGLKKNQVDDLRNKGEYNPWNCINSDPTLRKIVDLMEKGINGRSFKDIASSLTSSYGENTDYYLIFADFASYKQTYEKMLSDYNNKRIWSKKSLINIAHSGRFSGDKAALEYANKIWNIN